MKTTFSTKVKAVVLITIFFFGLLYHILVLLVKLYGTRRDKKTIKFQMRKRFCRFSNRILGVRLHILGNIPDSGTFLFVSNHRSFYDPIAFLSQIIANPVSKSEIAAYPLIGWGSRLTEVILVDRDNRRQRGKTKEIITNSLSMGYSVLIYPEGTTTHAPYTGNFKKGSFSSSFDAGVPVIPVAIEYQDETHYWIEKNMFQQFIHQFSQTKKTYIYMSVGTPISVTEPERAMNKARGAIDRQIQILRTYRNKKEGL